MTTQTRPTPEAERLAFWGASQSLDDDAQADFGLALREALAAERRATVERISPFLVHHFTCDAFRDEDASRCECGLSAILDEEAKGHHPTGEASTTGKAAR